MSKECIITLKKGNYMMGTIGKRFPNDEQLKELQDASKYDEVDITIGVIKDGKLAGIADVEDLEA